MAEPVHPEPVHPAADPATAETWAALRRQTSPDSFTTAVADLLVEVIDASRPVVDVGAGSGQLGQALAARGARMVSLDLSLPMLELVPAELRRVAADAVRLPVRDGAAGAVLAAHVLHVVPAWRQAVAELDRIAGSKGVVLVQAGASSGVRGRLPELRAVFRDHLPARALTGSDVAGPEGEALIDHAFSEAGRVVTELPLVEVPRRETAQGVIRWMQGNPWTWPGPSTDAERAAAATASAAWAAAAGLDLDEPFETAAVNRWRAYRRHPGDGSRQTAAGAAGGPG